MIRVLVIGLFTLLMCSCATRKATENNTALQLQGRWELTFLALEGKSFAELFGQRRPALEFNRLEKRVTGNTGCNQLAGTYTIHQQSLLFGSNIVVTKMACPDYDEQTFLQALSSINRFIIKSDQLNLLRDSTLIMSFTKK